MGRGMWLDGGAAERGSSPGGAVTARAPTPRPCSPARAPVRLIRRAVCLQTRAPGRCAPPLPYAAWVSGRPPPRAPGAPGADGGGLVGASSAPAFCTPPEAPRNSPEAHGPSAGGRATRGPRLVVEGGWAGAPPPRAPRARPARGRVGGAGDGRGRARRGAAPAGPGHVVRAPRPPLGGPGAVPAADYDSRQAPRLGA